jgi:DNA-binding response OmpR family regulator
MPDRKKILILDDEIDLCLLLRDYFQRKMYEVTISHTLKDGRDFLETLHPDILFLDNNLPDGEGWENAAQFAETYPGTYIILISAFHPVKPKMPASANYRIIEKPISRSDLDMQFSQL